MRLFAGGFADQIGELLAGEFAESLAAFRELFVEFDGGLSHFLMGFLGAGPQNVCNSVAIMEKRGRFSL